jgi:hypothetical protein
MRAIYTPPQSSSQEEEAHLSNNIKHQIINYLMAFLNQKVPFSDIMRACPIKVGWEFALT